MAEKPKPTLLDTIKAEVGRRAAKARTEKQMFESDFQEAYSFCLPQRIKPGDSSTTRPSGTSDNFSTIGEEVLTDFASDMADTFIPEHNNWAGVEVAATVPQEFETDAKAAAKIDTDTTFAAITASNFHEAGKQGFKDLGISAVGMAVEDPGAGQPFRCQVIPIGELLILRGATGEIDFRGWDRNLPAGDIEELFPDIDLPPKVKAAIAGKKYDTKFNVLQGCYRDRKVKAEVAWVKFTLIDNEACEGSRQLGVGSANILVARWDPDPNFSWGNGPALKTLADFRENDETAYLKLKGLARNVDPSWAYDDDQVINLEGGIPNGVAIPRLPGSKIDVLESRHGMDAALYAVDMVEQRIRRHFYQDGPVQKGKTPPTLGQWMDEALQKQRRLGTPAAPLWQEFLSEAYMRFRWLLVKRGELQEVIKVGGKEFPVRPINPLKRAANQEKAIACERVLASLGNLFGPETLPQIVDVGETAHNMVKLSDASGVTLHPKEQINATIKGMQEAAMAQQAAATAAPLMRAQQ
jgi:hypothetical protein